MLEVKNVSILYGSHVVIDALSANFEPTKIYGVVGLNGAGKTTLFNAIAGSKVPAKGELLLNGVNYKSKDINFLETTNYFYSYLTAGEYLDLFECTNEAYRQEELNQLFGLPFNEMVENYSTGMKKKLAILAMLKKDKAVYLLDEPFNGLDLESNKMLEIIVQLLKQKNKIVLISSHIIDPLKLCDEIILLEQGQFIKKYTSEDYNSLEKDLFGKFGDKAKLLLEKSF